MQHTSTSTGKYVLLLAYGAYGHVHLISAYKVYLLTILVLTTTELYILLTTH